MPKLTPGSNRCQCTACLRYFGSVSAADRHQLLRNGQVICRDPASLGMIQQDGWWVRSSMPRSAVSERVERAKPPALGGQDLPPGTNASSPPVTANRRHLGATTS
jgi:hypothetical protein